MARLQVLVDAGVNTFAMHSGLSESEFFWGGKTFFKMVSKQPVC